MRHGLGIYQSGSPLQLALLLLLLLFYIIIIIIIILLPKLSVGEP